MTTLLFLLGPNDEARAAAEARGLATLATAAPCRQFRVDAGWLAWQPGPSVVRHAVSETRWCFDLDSEGLGGPAPESLPDHAVRIRREGDSWCFQRGWHAERNWYLARAGSQLAIATSPVVALAALGLPREENPRAVAGFFVSTPLPPPECFLSGVSCLAPGQGWRLDPSGALSPIQAAFPARVPIQAGSDADWKALFETVLLAAIEANAGTGPVGLMLSGGIDSTTLAAGLAQARKPARLYSWHLAAQPAADESAYARATAEALGLPLRLVPVDQLPFADLDRLPMQPDAPLANPYRALNDALLQAARADGIGTVLSGNLGDHLYPEPTHAGRSAWRHGRPGLALGHLAVRIGRRIRRIGQGRFPAAGDTGLPWTETTRRLLAGFPDEPLPDVDPEDPTRTRDLFGTAVRLDAEGAWWYAGRQGVELRFPYRHAGFIELALAMPVHLMERRGQRKWLTRQWLAQRVPVQVHARPKAGSLAPWFWRGLRVHEDAVRALLFNPGAKWQTFINRDAVDRAFSATNVEAAGLRVWQAVCYETWRSVAIGAGALRYHHLPDRNPFP